jgi:Mrp family chromosome partitioning ATPase
VSTAIDGRGHGRRTGLVHARPFDTGAKCYPDVPAVASHLRGIGGRIAAWANALGGSVHAATEQMHVSDDGDLHLDAYLDVARRRWRYLVVVPLATVVLGAIFSMTRDKVFESEAEVIILTDDTRSLFTASPEIAERFGRNPLGELQFLSSEEFRESVESVDEEYGTEVDYALVPADPTQDATEGDVIAFTARGGDAEDVAEVANRHAEAYITERQQRDIESNARSKARAEARIQDLSDLLRRAGTLEETRQELVTVTELESELEDGEALARIHRAAEVPSSPVAPNIKRNIILALLGGLVLGTGVATVRELFDRRARDGASLARKLDTPLLGQIRRLPRRLLAPELRQPAGVPEEDFDDYRAVVNSIWLHSREEALRTIAVTSDRPGVGKTTTAINLARVEASRGLDVLLVDADSAEPSVAERLDLQRPAAALSDAINGPAGVGDAVVSTGTPHLKFAEASRDLEQHLRSGAFQLLLEDLQSQFDLVIMDVPAMLGRGDPRLICTAVDATILAYDPAVSRTADVERSVESLRQTGAGFVGLLANESSARVGRRWRPFNQDVRRRGTSEPRSSVRGHDTLPGEVSEPDLSLGPGDIVNRFTSRTATAYDTDSQTMLPSSSPTKQPRTPACSTVVDGAEDADGGDQKARGGCRAAGVNSTAPPVVSSDVASDSPRRRDAQVVAAVPAIRYKYAAQPFPSEGLLAEHMDWSFDELARAVLEDAQCPVYSYVVATVDRRPDGGFAQFGNSPNLQGGIVTLCARKHQLRSSTRLRDSTGVWIAGLTGAGVGLHGHRHLFYLMFAEIRAESQAEMWEHLGPETCAAKSATRHPLGDLYEPVREGLRGEARFMVDNYRPPCANHSHAAGNPPEWHKDIDVTYRAGRPILLAGDPQRSWLWSQPLIYLRETRPLSRNPAGSPTLDGFLDRLQPEDRL